VIVATAGHVDHGRTAFVPAPPAVLLLSLRCPDRAVIVATAGHVDHGRTAFMPAPSAALLLSLRCPGRDARVRARPDRPAAP